MGSRRWLLFVSYILLQLFVLTIAEENIIKNYCNYDYGGTYTSNSAFRRNLDTVPSFFTSNATFYNFSIGLNPPDKVNVIALCRGDIRPDMCRSCLNETNSILRENCTEEKESIIWSDNCMLRYSDRSIYGEMKTLPNAYAYNPTNASNFVQFNSVVRKLLDSLRGVAVRGGPVTKFATGNMSAGSDDTMIYGLVQCTPDLSERQCNECLTFTFGVLPKCCDGRVGGRVLTPNCHFRYELGRFYNEKTGGPPPADTPAPPPADATTPPPGTVPGKGGRNKESLIALINNNNSCDSHPVFIKFTWIKVENI